MSTKTVPSLKSARQVALDRREAKQNELDMALLQERSELAGEAQLKIEELMANVDIDDVSVLRAVNDVLNGQSVPERLPATPSLSDEEKELLNAFHEGRIVKTDKGSFRDTEWGKRERAPKESVTDSEPTKKEEKVEASAEADSTKSEPAPTKPKGLVERAKDIAQKAVANTAR